MIDVKFVGKVEDSGVDMNLVHIPAGFGVEEFWMSETPVTVRQWCEVMGLSCGEEGADLPKTQINVAEIEDFLEQLNRSTGYFFTLPRELQWCRAVGLEPESAKLKDYAVYGEQSLCSVKTKFPNEYGLYDMRGLVSEWVKEEAGELVLWGGSWRGGRDAARAVNRDYAHPTGRSLRIGFRVVCCRP